MIRMPISAAALIRTRTLSSMPTSLLVSRSTAAPISIVKPSMGLFPCMMRTIHHRATVRQDARQQRSTTSSSTTSTSPNTSPSSPPPSPPSTLLQRLLPRSIHPYLSLSRIDKPIGSWLLFWPCAWSLTLAAHYHSLPPSTLTFHLLLFASGAFIMRGAGCTINDMWDSNMDRLVSRTKSRPLAAGDLTHFQAWKFLGIQLSVGLAILTQLNLYSIALGASSLAIVVVYPLMKRVTYWPQLVLGFAFNWGAMLGWAALHAPPMWNVVLPLYAGSICWTIVYDTIYAHQDKNDDVTAGVKSTALLFGEHSKPVLTGFAASFVALVSTAVAQANHHSTAATFDLLHTHPVFTAALLPVVAHLVWQIYTVDLASRQDCWSKFTSNSTLGFILWLALLGDYLWATYTQQDDEQQQAEQQTNA